MEISVLGSSNGEIVCNRCGASIFLRRGLGRFNLNGTPHHCQKPKVKRYTKEEKLELEKRYSK